MSLQVDLRHSYPGISLDVQFEAGRGVTAVFGPSGAGKTSIINIISGISKPDGGSVQVNNRVLFDADTGVNVPPEARRMGVVFQDGRLFPHLDVARNLGFGARFAPGGLDRIELARVVAMLDLAPLMPRRPGTLSGGEKQRVALARALLSRPEILLMDEPLAALDDPRKDEVLPYLERLRDTTQVPIVYVSHSLSEIARLADRLIVLQRGRIVVSGSVEDVLSDPAALPFVGVREAGAVLPATVVGHEVDGLSRLALSGGELLLPEVKAPPGSHLRIRVLATDVLLSLEVPTGISSRNILPVTIRSLHKGSGPGVAVQLQCGEDQLLARITSRAAEELSLCPGLECHAILKATAIPRGSIGLARSNIPT